MGVIDWLYDRKSSPSKQVKGAVFYPINGSSSIQWRANDEFYLKSFLEVPELNAVINYKARASSNMRLDVVSKATLKPVDNNNPLAKVIRKPNWFQSQKEFLIQDKLFREIYANEYMYKLTPVGLSGSLKGLFTLPPNIIDIKSKDKNRFWEYLMMPENIEYIIRWGGHRIPLNTEDLIHLNDNRVIMDEDKYLKGVSKIDGLTIAIQNIRAAYESRNIIIENRGALGILTNDTKDGMGAAMPLDVKEKEVLQEDYRKYGTMKKQHQIIMTNLALKWQQTAIDSSKLQLFKEVEEDFMKICDAYGVPFGLFASAKGSTYANVNEAKKQLYQDTIIPEAVEWLNAINASFGTEGKAYTVSGTFDHLPVFQEDLRSRGEALNIIIGAMSQAMADQAITIEQYKQELERFGISQ